MDLILILVIILIPLIAQGYVSSSFNKYSGVKSKKGLTGVEVARMILDKNGLSDIHVVETPGNLTDHYDPRRKVVRLSSNVFHGDSISSVAVAAHECGHAIQDKESYLFFKIRSLIFPVVNVATSISYYIILIGFIFELVDMVYFGIGLTCLGLLFQIVTLPVEYNASARAKKLLFEYGINDSDELSGVKAVLNSAALTYVAGVVASALQILRLILINSRRD